MRVAEVVVKDLFGTFNHTIPFKLDERITIIHGPNGYGKTIILKMISGVLGGTYNVFYTVPYSKFVMRFDDGTRIEIQKASLPAQLDMTAVTSPPRSKKSFQRERRREPNLTCKFVSAEGHETPFRLGPSDGTVTERQLRDLDRFLPSNMRLTGDIWFDTDDGTPYSVEDILRVYGEYIRSQAPALIAGFGLEENSPLRRIQKEIQGHLITTDRLNAMNPRIPVSMYRHADPHSSEPRNSVERYSRDIVRQIGKRLALYAGRAAELDRTFPTRLLLETEKYEPIEKDALKTRFESIEQQRAKLIELGFLDLEEGGLQGIPDKLYEQEHKVISVYIGDMEQKLSTFAEMATKVGLLTEIVNKRFTHKTLQISRERGFVFKSKLGEIAATDLSSGEQHELVLLYELLFNVDKTWLVMLDEPEISLHVGWQKQFLNDLQSIVKLSSVDVLIATHSPVIIGNHWDDLTVPLVAPETEEDEDANG